MAPKKEAASAKERRKSSNDTPAESDSEKSSRQIVTLKVEPEKLRGIVAPETVIKEDSPAPNKESPSNSGTLLVAGASNNENASDSAPGTPSASQLGAMGPPTEGPKKKGAKRSSGVAIGNGEPKVRGKPGPKKKLRLEDGTPIDAGRGGGLAAHKLGPRANQGAINAGLRALDRSGKPCRKWNKGGFNLKSFTGTVWEIPRWVAPPKPKPAESATEDSATASAEGSQKENKENNSQIKSDNSNNGGDVEMSNAPSPAVNSPAPLAIAAA